MASLSDKLSSNMNFDAFAKAEDLQKRLLFTIGAIIVFRIGTFIPLPGIDGAVLKDIFHQNASGILGMFDMFTGGALKRMTILALNIMPYISASIIIQLGSTVVPQLESLKKEGASGQAKINQYTRYLTVLITALQAYGISVGLEAMNSSSGASAVIDPGYFFRFTTVVTLIGGTMFVVWLGEQITERGVGNGSSMILTAGILANVPMSIMQTLELGSTGALSPEVIIGVGLLICALFYGIVYIERAQRKIVIQYPKRQMGNRMFAGDSSHLPMKINASGVIPPIFASSILLLPITIANMSRDGGPEWLNTVTALMGRGQPLYLFVYASLIVFFTFFYTAIVFNPTETADNLRKHGGFVAGIRPGKNTAEYLDYVLTRLTVFAAIYLVVMCILPELLISYLNVPFYLGGTTLMIVTVVCMDFVNQIQSHLIAHQYEGLLKKANLGSKKKKK
jgi:preprotein translocase subunit SecY